MSTLLAKKKFYITSKIDFYLGSFVNKFFCQQIVLVQSILMNLSSRRCGKYSISFLKNGL